MTESVILTVCQGLPTIQQAVIPIADSGAARNFAIIKNAYNPAGLEHLLSDLGWSAVVSPLTPEVYVVVANQHQAVAVRP